MTDYSLEKTSRPAEAKRSRAVHLATRFLILGVVLATVAVFFGHGHGPGEMFAMMLIPSTAACALLSIGCIVAAAIYDMECRP